MRMEEPEEGVLERKLHPRPELLNKGGISIESEMPLLGGKLFFKSSND